MADKNLMDVMGTHEEREPHLIAFFTLGFLAATAAARGGKAFRPSLAEEVAQEYLKSKIGVALPGFPEGMNEEQCKALLVFMRVNMRYLLNAV